jgi:hypothetical protein
LIAKSENSKRIRAGEPAPIFNRLQDSAVCDAKSVEGKRRYFDATGRFSFFGKLTNGRHFVFNLRKRSYIASADMD